jgi:hypothetical protein
MHKESTRAASMAKSRDMNFHAMPMTLLSYNNRYDTSYTDLNDYPVFKSGLKSASNSVYTTCSVYFGVLRQFRAFSSFHQSIYPNLYQNCPTLKTITKLVKDERNKRI